MVNPTQSSIRWPYLDPLNPFPSESLDRNESFEQMINPIQLNSQSLDQGQGFDTFSTANVYPSTEPILSRKS